MTGHLREFFVDRINELGLPLNDKVGAIQDFMARDLTHERYQEIYNDITKVNRLFANKKEARLYTAYLIQAIMEIGPDDDVQMESIISSVDQKADSFISKHPYVVTSYNQDSVDPTDVPLESQSDPTSIPRKSHKHPTRIPRSVTVEEIWKNNKGKTRAEIIQAFIAAGITKAGANTYFYNMKKKYGFNEEVKVKKQTKEQVARIVYSELVGRDKKEIIDAIAARANTSKAGATTYYYLCKKEESE